MTLLDDLSGLEFETKMTTAFEKYDGYHNVHQTQLTGDEGRDILMRETINGRERVVVVTDGGSLAAHASLVAREYGIPAVVGAEDATLRLHDGQTVTVNGGAGVVEIIQ